MREEEEEDGMLLTASGISTVTRFVLDRLKALVDSAVASGGRGFGSWGSDLHASFECNEPPEADLVRAFREAPKKLYAK